MEWYSIVEQHINHITTLLVLVGFMTVIIYLCSKILKDIKKKKEVKEREIDEKLEEITKSDVKATKTANAVNTVTEDLLEEMDTTNRIVKGNIQKHTFNLDDAEENVNEELSFSKVKEDERIEFDEKDDLISSLEKEIEVEEREEIDLLRDLKGQKFEIQELESEILEILQTIKKYKTKE